MKGREMKNEKVESGYFVEGISVANAPNWKHSIANSRASVWDHDTVNSSTAQNPGTIANHYNFPAYYKRVFFTIFV